MRSFLLRSTVAATVAALFTSAALAFDGKASTGGDSPHSANPLVATPKPGLKARQPVPKSPTVRKPARVMPMLIVKFGDPVIAGDSVRNGALTLTDPYKDFENQILELQNRFDVTFRQAVPQGDAKLNEMYKRAEKRSGRMQPNLKSYMYVEGPEANLQTVADALHAMPITEIVQWYEDMRPQGDPPTGACCVPMMDCEVMTEAACTLAGGTYDGDETDCSPDPCVFGACCFRDAIGGFECADGVSEDDCNNEIGGYFQGDGSVCDLGMGEMICDDLDADCGEGTAGSCYWADGENGTPFCSDQACCDLVCDQDPYCCDENTPGAHWDEFCASTANALCMTPPANRCATPFAGSCGEPNFLGGCDNQECCETVCALDPFCCLGAWDAGCVQLARENCTLADPTDDFTPLQGYRSPGSYESELMAIPPQLQALLPITEGGFLYSGFGGEGWNLFDSDNPHAGMYGMGQELIDIYNHDLYGEGSLTRGKTIKVGVIEWGYWGPEPFVDLNGNDKYNSGEPFSDINGDGQYTVQHEDLDVTLEPGQRLFLNPVIAANDHGTACLGIINAKENEFGMTGIAPDAEAWFFPLTSVDEGPRPIAAWSSALTLFAPGDVLSASYGPGPATGNLNNDAAMWPIFRLASDLGITVLIAAGNDCYNLDNAPDLGDSGAMVIGACSPGYPWYRLAFSNFCTNPTNTRSNIVHVKAWGTRVATCGYGGLAFPDEDPYRSYTLSFGGTSAATPEVAGVVACLQGLAKQFYGIPLTPELIRAALGAPGIPPAPPTRLFGGFDDSGGNCSLDFDPTEGPHMIGPYPDVAGTFSSAATTILNQSFAGFGDSPLITDVIILNGTKIFGNAFSVKGFDGNYFVTQSKYQDRNGPDVPANLPPNVPANVIDKATYYTTGQIIDVLAVGRSPVANVSNITVQVIYEVPPGVTSIAVVEAYDWQSRRWNFIGMQYNFDLGGTVINDTYTIPSPARYLRPADRTILYRFWQASFGSSNPGGAGGNGLRDPFVSRIDFMGLSVTQGFASPFTPPIF